MKEQTNWNKPRSKQQKPMKESLNLNGHNINRNE